jgi:O-acetyl-ADP-ribose deacetylase (regulator of RNase III)
MRIESVAREPAREQRELLFRPGGIKGRDDKQDAKHEFPGDDVEASIKDRRRFGYDGRCGTGLFVQAARIANTGNEAMFRLIGQNRIELVQGDITRQEADAVVNAANSALAGGGGVDGAIHRAAGPSVMEETQRRYPDGCPTGSAVATRAGKLHAKHIFHAVGPIWRGGTSNEDALLRSAVAKCIELAEAYSCNSVAFPAISTGVYGYPLDLAAQATVETIVDHLRSAEMPKLVRIVLFSEGAYGQFARVLGALPLSDVGKSH